MEETNKRWLALLVIGVLIGGFAVAIVATSDTANAYNVRGPITINGNAGFTPENGVTGGSGTESDPYVIEGWEIEVFATTGISITGTDEWFVIRGVHLYNPNMTSSNGVSLWGVQNGRIDSSVFEGLGWGIEMSASSQVVVSDCEMTSYGYAVYLLDCTDIAVTRCNITGNDYTGVGIFDCTDSRFENNNITDMGTGMLLHGSSGILVSNNTIARSWSNGLRISSCTGLAVYNNSLTSDGITLEGTGLTHYNSHDITEDNLVNGDPVYYIADQSAVLINGIPVGQLIVVGSTDVTIGYLEIEDTDTSIQLAYCLTVTIYYCQLTNNTNDAIHATESADISVSNCVITGVMYGSGLRFDACSEIEVGSIQVYECGSGVYFEDSSEALVISSIIQGQSGWIHLSYGVCIYESCNITLALALIDGFDVGVWGYHAWYWSPPGYVQIISSVVGDCTDGLRFTSSSHVTIEDSFITGCSNGIVADASSDMQIARNIIADNENGLTILGGMSFMTWVYHNNFVNNTLQASDTSMGNYWDLGYPDGGNYWSDYAGVDLMNGPGQNLSGSDGIGDTPQTVSGTSIDHYPLMLPYPSNRPPIASFAVTPSSGDMFILFTFDASNSSDYDDPVTPLEVRWDWESDGTWDTDWSTDLIATHGFSAPGTYQVTLLVRDSNGTMSTTSVEVEVAGVIPEFGALVLPIMLTLVAVVVAIRRTRISAP